jgi:hypothetical protein
VSYSRKPRLATVIVKEKEKEKKKNAFHVCLLSTKKIHGKPQHQSAIGTPRVLAALDINVFRRRWTFHSVEYQLDDGLVLLFRERATLSNRSQSISLKEQTKYFRRKKTKSHFTCYLFRHKKKCDAGVAALACQARHFHTARQPRNARLSRPILCFMVTTTLDQRPSRRFHPLHHLRDRHGDAATTKKTTPVRPRPQ